MKREHLRANFAHFIDPNTILFLNDQMVNATEYFNKLEMEIKKGYAKNSYWDRDRFRFNDGFTEFIINTPGMDKSYYKRIDKIISLEKEKKLGNIIYFSSMIAGFLYAAYYLKFIFGTSSPTPIEEFLAFFTIVVMSGAYKYDEFKILRMISSLIAKTTVFTIDTSKRVIGKIINFFKGKSNNEEDKINNTGYMNMDFMKIYIDDISIGLAHLNPEDREVFTEELFGKIDEYRSNLRKIPNLAISAAAVDGMRRAFIGYLIDLRKKITNIIDNTDYEFRFTGKHDSESTPMVMTSDGKVRKKAIEKDSAYYG